MLKELLENDAWKQIKKQKDFKVDWEKPFTANKLFIKTEEERSALKQKGIYNPFSISGSKAKRIVKEWKQRFREIFTNKQSNLDLESMTRMKWGAVSEELVMKEIVPMHLSTPYWHNKVLVLDKRRYQHPDYPFISVEYDVLSYTLTPKGEEFLEEVFGKRPKAIDENNRPAWVIDPNSEEEYACLDKALENQWIIPFMILDLKNTQNDIEQNTKDYKYQLNLGMWMSPQFKYWSILGFIKNAKIEYYPQIYDKETMETLFTTYNEKYLPLVLMAMQEIELFKGDETQAFAIVEFCKNLIKDNTELEVDLGNGEKLITKELTDETSFNAITWMGQLAPLLAERKKLTAKIETLTENIKELQVPTDAKLYANTENGKVSWVKFIRAGTSKFDMKAFNNDLYERGIFTDEVQTIYAQVGNRIEPINLKDYYVSTNSTVSEYPLYKANAKVEEEMLFDGIE